MRLNAFESYAKPASALTVSGHSAHVNRCSGCGHQHGGLAGVFERGELIVSA